MKTVTLGQILNEELINESIKLYQELKDTGTFAKVLKEKIIEPRIEEINKALGQENDPMYLAYVVEHLFRNGLNL